jgi:hypothetical protein
VLFHAETEFIFGIFLSVDFSSWGPRATGIVPVTRTFVVEAFCTQGLVEVDGPDIVMDL